MTTVVVFGANDQTRAEVFKASEAKGYDVIAAIRRRETVAPLGVRAAAIDLARLETLTTAMKGADAVISCLGHGRLKAPVEPTTPYSSLARTCRAVMRETGGNRLTMLLSGGDGAE
ncbi:MAG: NAD(P)H-binding protein [Paracoccaceae bacterium]